MTSKFTRNIIKSVFFLSLIFNSAIAKAQNDSIVKPKSAFWQKVRFGGGLGLGVGSGYTNISLSPTMYYNVNTKFAFGVGLTGSYIAQKSNADFLDYKSTIFGGSLIGLINPVETIQLSAELEQLKVNRNFNESLYIDDSFWNTALFLGAGYQLNRVTIGVRYNVLHNNQNNVYSQAWLPFMRVIF
jgi:long-subunit fatty acid transport protein